MKINKSKLFELACCFLCLGSGWTLTAILRTKIGIEIGLFMMLLGIVAGSIWYVLDDK